MAISKITGLEIIEKASAIEETYIDCEGRGLVPVAGSDTDGIKGKCPECRAMIELRNHAEHGAVLVGHLAGGKTPPVAAGTKGVRTAEPTRTYGQKVNFRGNVASDVCDVAPIVMGRDTKAVQPRPKMHKGREVPTNGTNAGGLGRAHIVMNPMTDLVGKAVPGMRGEDDPRVTRAEFETYSQRQRQRYNKKIGTMRDAARAQYAKRRKFEREHGPAVPGGNGPTAARPYGDVPTGTRTGIAWDSSKGGRFVDTIGRRSGERSPLNGIEMDRKPSGLKYKSEPIFGRTVRA